MEVDAPSFQSMGLDPRILKAVFRLGWVEPTPVQSQGIPLALEGNDILTKAKTGSGKTAVYLLPIMQRLLSKDCKGVTAIVVVPSKELCQQVCLQIRQLACACSREVKAVDVVANGTKEHILFEEPNILVGRLRCVVASYILFLLRIDIISSFSIHYQSYI